jgi:uncharacterized membrane protein
LTQRLPRLPSDATRASARHVVLRVAALTYAPLLVAYPVLVYYAMQHYSARVTGAVLLVGMSPLLLRTLRAKRNPAATSSSTPTARQRLSSHWAWPVLGLALIVVAMVVNSVRSLLLVPVCINGALLLTFGLTLLDERPLVERFARLQHDDLTSQERHWCRLWTAIWTAFFGFNIVLAAWFTAAESLDWWTYYNGLIAYAVMGLLFTTEYVVRKFRFQRFGDHGLDRALRWCFLKLGWVQ